jgi:enterochelin esterase family protein
MLTLEKHATCLSIVICMTTVFPNPCRSQSMRPHQIGKDRRVTFTVDAPLASQVKLIPKTDAAAMGAKEYELERDEDGIWTVTTNACRPGFHYYQLEIDGFECPDPKSQKYFGWGWWASALEIPDPDRDFYLPKDVPHGDIRVHWYHSQVTGQVRKCLVYTPPGYDIDQDQRYPVVYLQHGAGECELGWTMQGKVNFILDNLIAARKAAPMLIVMNNGYAPRPGAPNPHRPSRDDNVFGELILQDVVPAIDSNFRTIADRDNRAIAGLSMGAGQAMQIGLENLDTFGAIGSFSSGSRNFDPNTSYGGIFKNSSVANQKINLLWIGCGELDFLFERAGAMHESLQKLGVQHVWRPGPGAHEWQVWRHHIHEFAQSVFAKDP